MMASIRNLVEQGMSYLCPGVEVTDKVIANANAEYYLQPEFVSFREAVRKRKEIIAGSISLTTTRTGKNLSLVPFFIPNYTTKNKFRSDWLIVFALDSDGEIVGARTNHIVLGITGPESKGTLASFTCGEGVGRALEMQAEKCMEEVALRYEREFGVKRPITHTIQDDQAQRLAKLEGLHDESDHTQKTIQHFRSDRPRWIALWEKDGRILTFHGKDHQIGIATELQNGANVISAQTIALKMQK